MRSRIMELITDLAPSADRSFRKLASVLSDWKCSAAFNDPSIKSAISDAFVQWRYVYEHAEVTMSMGFLDKLAVATQAAVVRAIGA